MKFATALLGLLTTAGSLALATPLAGRNNDGKSSGKNSAGYDTSRVGPSNANCNRQTYDVTVTSENMVFQNIDSSANETAITTAVREFITGNFTQEYLSSGTRNVTGTYSISGTLCTPKNGANTTSAIQLLVHGIGFDSSYWDFAVEGESIDYSYVSAASAAGHTTFRYDRLGTGLSEHPEDTYNVVQAATDLAILEKIVEMLKDGKIGGQAYTKIAAVGHSYGSIQLQALTANVPTAVDTVVLTGFSTNTSFVPIVLTSAAWQTASYIAPERFAEEDSRGYLITSTPYTNQLNFAYAPYFTNAAFKRARATEQPVTQGVLFTFGGLPAPASQYNGRVLVVTADRDWIFCGSACIAGAPAGQSSIPAGVSQLYPAASSFEVQIPANVGHAQVYHVQAPSIYADILSYLDRVFYN